MYNYNTGKLKVDYDVRFTKERSSGNIASS